MRALTVREPWAWAIAYGGKNVENRTALWRYRGPLAIHAGAAWSPSRTSTDTLAAAWARVCGPAVPLVYGAIIAVTELVDIHQPDRAACDPAVCTPWGERSFTAAGGRRVRTVAHLVLEATRAVPPMPCTGYLGLWTVPDDIRAELTG